MQTANSNMAEQVPAQAPKPAMTISKIIKIMLIRIGDERRDMYE